MALFESDKCYLQALFTCSYSNGSASEMASMKWPALLMAMVACIDRRSDASRWYKMTENVIWSMLQDIKTLTQALLAQSNIVLWEHKAGMSVCQNNCLRWSWQLIYPFFLDLLLDQWTQSSTASNSIYSSSAERRTRHLSMIFLKLPWKKPV